MSPSHAVDASTSAGLFEQQDWASVTVDQFVRSLAVAVVVGALGSVSDLDT